MIELLDGTHEDKQMRLNWTRKKPTEPGAYWLRGFELGNPGAQALIEVRRWRGDLRCNIGECTYDRNYDEWSHVADMGSFRWCGPLVPPNA